MMLALAVVGVVIGLAVVLVGLAANLTLVGVLGFVLIVGSCVGAAGVLRGPRQNSAASLTAPAHDPRNRSSSLRTKMEDRMRRRFDEG